MRFWMRFWEGSAAGAVLLEACPSELERPAPLQAGGGGFKGYRLCRRPLYVAWNGCYSVNYSIQ